MKTIIAFLLLATSIQAAEHRYPSGLVVSDAIAVQALPDFVKHMSDSEYFSWALAQNSAAVAASVAENAQARRQPDRYASVSESSGGSQTRFGGGVGVNGYGGAGGYAGYAGTGSDQGGGMGYGGFASSRAGNSVQTSGDSISMAYDKVFSDRTYYGSAVVILNPFCRPR